MPLPAPAEDLVPHRLPLRLVDRVLTVAETSGTADAVVRPDGPLTRRDGTLDPVALVELIAQSYAAVRGYQDRAAGLPIRQGFLVGVRAVRFGAPARVGDRLVVTVSTAGQVEGFAVAEGVVRRGDEVLAEGSLNLWLTDDAAGGAP